MYSPTVKKLAHYLRKHSTFRKYGKFVKIPLYDRIVLDVILREPQVAMALFTKLFQELPMDLFFRFLDDDVRLLELIRICLKAPPAKIHSIRPWKHCQKECLNTQNGKYHSGRILVAFITIAYLCAVLSGITDIFSELFKRSTPLFLVTVSLMCLWEYRKSWNTSFSIWFCGTFTGLMAIEIVGVWTGFPFGHYSYTSPPGAAHPGCAADNWSELVNRPAGGHTNSESPG